MQELFAFAFEAGASIRHHALALGSSNFTAQIRLARFAELAFAAFRGAKVRMISKVRGDLRHSKERFGPTITLRHCLLA